MFFLGSCEESVILQLFSSMVILISRFVGSRYCGLMFKALRAEVCKLKCIISDEVGSLGTSVQASNARGLPRWQKMHAAYLAGGNCTRC